MRIISTAIFISIIFIFPLSIGCTTAAMVTSSSIRKDIMAIKQDINANRSAMNGLKNKRVSNTGFYYVVDIEGFVVFHPQAALIGSNFKKHWFIDKIITERSGCLTYQLGNRTHVIYFEQLNDSEILCLSIVSDDILQTAAECRQAEPK
jgi:hypothetical protein